MLKKSGFHEAFQARHSGGHWLLWQAAKRKSLQILKGSLFRFFCGCTLRKALVTDFVNLYATTPAGQQIKSSTFHLIGEGYNLALGINFDYTSLVYANKILVDLMSAEADLQSAMWQGGDTRLAALFDECLSAVGKPVAALNKRDRMKIIALLDQKNAFSFRKSVPFVAKHLQVSRYTVYKYLGELAEFGGGDEGVNP